MLEDPAYTRSWYSWIGDVVPYKKASGAIHEEQTSMQYPYIISASGPFFSFPSWGFALASISEPLHQWTIQVTFGHCFITATKMQLGHVN